MQPRSYSKQKSFAYYMFKKIIDQPPCSIQIEFLQSFGLDCLSKIRNIEIKFNQVEWQSEKHSFEGIALKVKTMLECYQLIAHQIYDSFQSVQLEGLGHAIVKMYLQIASAIKWLIKSFTVSYHKEQKITQRLSLSHNHDNQSERFRKREISRFILQGVMKNRGSDFQQQEQNLQTIQNLFSRNKENIRNSKNKILSIHSSNLPLLLEDTVDYLTKKSEYIDKFIALRENYEGLNRLEVPMTSQAIMQTEHELKKNQSSNRLKNIFSKIIAFQDSKKPKTSQKSTQVSINPSVTQKLKKAAQKSKIKSLTEEIELEKNKNRQLKHRLQFYESKFELKSYGEEQQFQIVNKKLSYAMNSKKSSRFEQNFQKNSSLSMFYKEEDQQQNQPENTTPVEQKKNEAQTEFFKSTRNLKKRTSKIAKRVHSFKEAEVNTSTAQNSAPSSLKNTCPTLKLFSKIHEISIQNRLSKQSKSLKLSSLVLNMEIILQNKAYSKDLCLTREKPSEQVEEVEQKITDEKGLEFTTQIKPTYVSSPVSVADENFISELKAWNGRQTLGQFENSICHFGLKNKKSFFGRTPMRNLSSQKAFLDCNGKEKQQNLKQKFENIYSPVALKSIQISALTLCKFFISEQIAKNYQILNLSQKCHIGKKMKSKQPRYKKIQSEINGVSTSKKENDQPAKTVHSAYQIIVVLIYQQIHRLKKGKKLAYFQILLFLRYPHSYLCTGRELERKCDDGEERQFCLAELQNYFKRIIAIHSQCHTHPTQFVGVKWCEHIQFILSFFGIRKLDKTKITLPST